MSNLQKAIESIKLHQEPGHLPSNDLVRRSASMNAFPWDNTDKDSLEQLQALLKETGREVTLQELQELQRKVWRETAGLPNDEEIEYS